MKPAFLLALFLLAVPVRANDLNVNISGRSHEKAPLETLSPNPSIPTAEEMTFSLDGGKSAVEDEVIPLTAAQAALKSDLSRFQIPLLPLIPYGPFIVQPIPRSSDPSLSQFRTFGKRGPSPAVSHWEFLIVDDTNQEIYRSTGSGLPSAPLTWDGQGKNGFELRPDQTYFPFLTLSSTSPEISVRIPGEAERYLAYQTKEDGKEILTFGNRLFERDRSIFSEAGRFYLKDLKYRITQLDPRAEFRVSLYCSNESAELCEARKKAWQDFMESTLQRKIDPEWFSTQKIGMGLSQSQVTLMVSTASLPPVMTGRVRDIRPGLEDMKSWLQIRESGKYILVEMRNDRLFRSGSAFLRDEALPLVIEALQRVTRLTHDHEKPAQKPVLLRSYMKKPREVEKRESFEEDPKLAALRSKVLFMLFAEATYQP